MLVIETFSDYKIYLQKVFDLEQRRNEGEYIEEEEEDELAGFHKALAIFSAKDP